MNVQESTCEAKHSAIGQSLDHIRDAIDKVESRQWYVILAIAGTAVMTLVNLLMARVH